MNKEHPILFSTPMIQATEEGRKTKTRRIIKSSTGKFNISTANFEPNMIGYYGNRMVDVRDEYDQYVKILFCPYGEVGDTLYVRESWKLIGWNFEDGEARIQYADGVTVSHDLPDDDKAND